MKFTGRTTLSAIIRRLNKAEEDIESVGTPSPALIQSAVQDYLTENPVSVSWSTITNKPSTFVPSTHTHSGYAETDHEHTATDITTDTNNRFVSDAEKTAYAAKQDALVSGTNIKTVNGASVLGSGDLIVGGSSAVSWGKYF